MLLKKYPLLYALTLLFFFSGFSQERPNVVLIVLDDMNDYIGAMGGHPQAQTPNIDRLISEGVLFANAHSNAPVCAPSRASFMSGILPSSSSNYGFENRMKNEILSNSKTISEFAMENGYLAFQTGKIQHQSTKKDWTEMGVKKYQGPLAYNGKKPAPHPSVPKAFGAIGPLDGTFASLADVPDVPASKNAPGYKGWWHVQKKKPFRYVNDEDRDLLTDEKSAIWWQKKVKTLEASKENKPFFMAFGIMNPHTPHVVPQKYFDLYPLKTLKLPIIKKGDNKDCSYLDVLSGKGVSHFGALQKSYPTIDDGIRAYLQGYLAAVSFADHIVGDVLESIENSKFKDNTIVILTSDHGYNIGEKEYLFKNSPWEESTRIPFVIRDPSNKKNASKKVKHPISLIDLYPTIADVCDFKGSTLKNDKGHALDGFSLVPFLKNPENGRWKGPDVALTVIKNKNSPLAGKQNYSIRSKEFRYVHYCNGKEELYYHNEDPYEWKNEINNPKFKTIKQKLQKELKNQIPDLK
tara:strand:+ start:17793 stop:19355 length:1563 start_codon:yes stop_codon:yes gene_type:complete